MNIRGGVEDTRLEAKAKDTKKSEAKDTPSEDRPSRGQGQECSMPKPRTKDTGASVLQKQKKETGLQNFFSDDIQKKGLQNFFSGSLQQKRSTKFQQFKELCCPRAEDRAIFVDLKLRGQGLQNKSWRPRSP